MNVSVGSGPSFLHHRPEVRSAPDRVTKSGRGGAKGQSRSSALTPSDLNLLGYGESIIDIDAQISDRALNLGMAEQELYRSQIVCAPVGGMSGIAPMCLGQHEHLENLQKNSDS